MEDERVKQFYRAASRAGLSSAVPQHLRPQIDEQVAEEDAAAPMSGSSPRRAFIHSPKKSSSRKSQSSCGGGVCQPPGSARDTEVVKLSARGDNEEQLTEDILVKNKYFDQSEIENLKMRRLQDIAECDRQRVMSVLSPVVSLLDGLQLADNADQSMLEDIKARLSCIGGPNISPPSCPGSGVSTARKRESTPLPTHSIRGARTSAIRPYVASPKSLDSSEENAGFDGDESYDETNLMNTGCGIFGRLAATLRSFISWKPSDVSLTAPEMDNVHIPSRLEGKGRQPGKTVMLSPGSIPFPHVMSPSHVRVQQRMVAM